MKTEILDPRSALARDGLTAIRPEGPFTRREMLSIFFKDWRRILAAFALPVMIALVAAAAATPRFEASASLLVRIGREYFYRPEFGDGGPGVAFDREQTLKSEVAILASRDLVEQVITAMGLERLYPDLAEDEPAESRQAALLRFHDRLDALLVKDSNVIRVTFAHPDAAVAAEAVNRLVEAYLERRRGLFFDPRAAFLGERVEHFRARLAELELTAEQFRRDNGIVAYDSQRAILLDQRAAVNMQLNNALNDQAEIRQKLVTARGNLTKAERSGRPSLVHAVDKEILELETGESSVAASIAVLTAQLAETDGQIAVLARSKRELDGLERELALAAENYQTYARKFEEARMLEERDLSQAANVRVIQPARPPAEPRSRALTILAVGLAVGVMAALMVAFVSEGLRATFLMPEMAERGLGLPVLAAFPLTGEPPRRPSALRTLHSLIQRVRALPPPEAT